MDSIRTFDEHGEVTWKQSGAVVSETDTQPARCTLTDCVRLTVDSRTYVYRGMNIAILVDIVSLRQRQNSGWFAFAHNPIRLDDLDGE